MIDINKQYKTRSGLPVRILCVDCKTNQNMNVVGLIDAHNMGQEVPLIWSMSGQYWPNGEKSDFDLNEVLPYEDFKVDDLCVVWNTKRKFFRYFFKAENNIAYCFSGGTTSYTAEGAVNPWENCRKATPEEIETKKILSWTIEDGYF